VRNSGLRGERVAVTLDIDWAPDFVIDHVARALAAREVAATWFVTHASPAVDRLRERPDLFELGIHPNFGAGSTHGATPEDVLAHVLAIVPGARSMRTHGLIQSSALLALVRARTEIAVDASLFLPHAAALAAVDYPLPAGALRRVPFFYEDDAEMLRERPDWDAAGLAREADGLAVFDFHPIHVYLNSADTGAYERLKAGGFPDVGPAAVDALVGDGPGAGTAFSGLLDALAGARGRTVSELGAAA
jgi:hypothetical protein